MNAATQPISPRYFGTRFVNWQVRTTESDTARWLTWTTVLGLATAVALALVGGLPFDIPMPTYRFGVVTPTCGLTRGSTAIVRGDFGLAWRYNPASFLVIIAGAIGIARAVVGATHQRWIMLSCTRSRSAVIVIGVTIAALSLYQQTNADFIINSRR